MKQIAQLCVLIVVFFLTAGCWMNSSDDPPGNSPPYAVIGPSSPQDFPEDTGDKTFQLVIDEQDGKKDPDGDTVYFKSSTLPLWISLDENTGEVTVDTNDAHSAEDCLFWSEDEHGDDSQSSAHTIAISVTFS